MAAKHHQTIAEMYETEAADLERAIQHYEQVKPSTKNYVQEFGSI